MKVLTDFHLIHEMPTAFLPFQFFVYKHCQQWRPKCIVKTVLINNMGFQVLMLNSGIKRAFKCEERQ